MTAKSPVEVRAIRILAALYAFELSALLVGAALYKAPLATASGSVRILLGVGAAGGFGSAALLVSCTRSSGAVRGRAVRIAVPTNLLSIFLIAALGETGVRLLSHTTPQGTRVGETVLAPSWSELVARSRAAIAQATPSGTWREPFFTFDPELGWTVGPDRRSSDGLYASSVEGLRSARAGVKLADVRARWRVALVGDSNAFSLEVPFEESWGHFLQEEVGPDAQILNFGVDGFGIDQMLLRYRRDVRPWQPEVVVVAFIAHDFLRTLSVYPMLSLGWPGFVVKPRFVLDADGLRLVNVPLPMPKEVLAVADVHRLPHVELDLAYGGADRSWTFADGSLLVRLLTSRFPRWQAPDPRVSDDASEALNARLLSTIAEDIARDGAETVLVYLPPPPLYDDGVARQAIERSGVAHLDMTDCVSHVPLEERRVPSGHHYTGRANQALARCIAPVLRRSLLAHEDVAARASGQAISRRRAGGSAGS